MSKENTARVKIIKDCIDCENCREEKVINGVDPIYYTGNRLCIKADCIQCPPKGIPDWCPLPKMLSEEDIVDMFAKHCYPIRYDTNSAEQGMTIAGIRQVIHEILYKNEGKKDE